MSVRWSPASRADLEQISDYIADDNPERAASFIDEITQTGNAIGDMPRAFPIMHGLEHLGIRHRVHGRYLIFYRVEGNGVEGNGVEIIRVIHGARDYIRVLFPDYDT